MVHQVVNHQLFYHEELRNAKGETKLLRSEKRERLLTPNCRTRDLPQARWRTLGDSIMFGTDVSENCSRKTGFDSSSHCSTETQSPVTIHAAVVLNPTVTKNIAESIDFG
jgi:hypothetical protein